MATSGITIDSELMKSVMQEALLRQLKDIDREALITGALAHLMEPVRREGWGGSGPSPITQAFNDAARDACRKILWEEFDKPEIKARLTALVTKSLNTIFADSNNQVSDAMSAAFISAITVKDS